MKVGTRLLEDWGFVGAGHDTRDQPWDRGECYTGAFIQPAGPEGVHYSI